ncbi:hypothetical protein IRB23SM22_13480 [Alkalibacterium sp. s-m-22]
MTDIKLIEALSNAPGAPGFEDEVIDVVLKHKGSLKAKKTVLKICTFIRKIMMRPNRHSCWMLI